MKKIFATLLLTLAFAAGAHAQKFALIDMEYIMSNVPAYERANEQLNQISKKWQAEVDALDNEAKTLYRNYQNEAVFLSEAQKKQREESIVAKEKEAADLKKKYFSSRRTLQKAHLPARTHSGRSVQCRQRCGTKPRFSAHSRSCQRRSRHYLCFAQHRHQQ